MSIQEKFNDLPNITKNIENKMKSLNKNINPRKKIDEDTPQKIKETTKMQCKIEIDQVDSTLSKENTKIKDSISKKKKKFQKILKIF